MQFSLFKGELWTVTVIKDFGLLFTSSGRAEIIKERHHLHFLVTIPISVAAFGLMLLANLWLDMQIDGWPWWFFMCYCGFAALIANAWREKRKQTKGGKHPNGQWAVPFSYRDVRFGTYAGVLTGLIIHFIY